MDRTEFILGLTVVLFIAFALGWFASWLVYRVTRSAGSELSELDALAQSLHEAEEMRDQAISYAQAREAEFANKLSQSEAELRAAMEGLRDARSEAEDLRAYIERASSNE